MSKRHRHHKKHERQAALSESDQGADNAAQKGEADDEASENWMSMRQWPGRLKAFWIGAFPKEPVARFTALIFVATTIYAVTAIFQLFAIYESNKLAHRAWVLLDTIDKIEIRPGVQVGTVVRFKNFGSGPALDVRFIVATHPPTTSNLLPTDHFKPLRQGIGESRGTVAQGQGISSIDVRVGGFDPNTIAGMQEERVHFYVYGRIEYRDQFGKGHWTAFCRRLEIHDLKAGTTGLFAACRGSDDAD